MAGGRCGVRDLSLVSADLIAGCRVATWFPLIVATCCRWFGRYVVAADVVTTAVAVDVVTTQWPLIVIYSDHCFGRYVIVVDVVTSCR